ncbi:hypothetical protein CI610_00354 [invertebrate metagenome]|uniref:Phage tail assembly protein n=1 Tax=invertebrate metagenome TaxID=1711999 RepID=A0A2H9TBW5_9ZZZZ
MNADDLFDCPPLGKETLTLASGHEVTVYELPIGAMTDIQSYAEDQGDTRAIVRVVAQSLLGRKPSDGEMEKVEQTFGVTQVMKIYHCALKLSRVDGGGVDEEKKG